MASTNNNNVLFEETFQVTELNPDGYKRERVDRLLATSTKAATTAASSGTNCDLLLDINCEIYPLQKHDTFTLALASTLYLDGTNNNPTEHELYDAKDPLYSHSQPTLADDYEYVMHGRVFDVSYEKDKFVEKEHQKKDDGTVVIAFSFGGLLMKLTGNQRHLVRILPDMRLYLLINKKN